LYGRAGCGWCTKIKGDFDKNDIVYSFVSCDVDAGNREMWAFLQENNHTGSVGLPVGNVDGVLKIRPSVTDVLDIRAGKGGKPAPARQAPAPQAPKAQPYP